MPDCNEAEASVSAQGTASFSSRRSSTGCPMNQYTSTERWYARLMPGSPTIRHTSVKVSPQTERRDSPRFRMECRVRYRAVGRSASLGFSHGKTVNMSGSGILLVTDNVLPPGWLIELEIEWPARLDDGVPLKMVVRGKIVRSEKKDVALTGVRILRYDFRTAGAQPGDL
jgi:hypothetical protein